MSSIPVVRDVPKSEYEQYYTGNPNQLAEIIKKHGFAVLRKAIEYDQCLFFRHLLFQQAAQLVPGLTRDNMSLFAKEIDKLDISACEAAWLVRGSDFLDKTVRTVLGLSDTDKIICSIEDPVFCANRKYPHSCTPMFVRDSSKYLATYVALSAHGASDPGPVFVEGSNKKPFISQRVKRADLPSGAVLVKPELKRGDIVFFPSTTMRCVDYATGEPAENTVMGIPVSFVKIEKPEIRTKTSALARLGRRRIAAFREMHASGPDPVGFKIRKRSPNKKGPAAPFGGRDVPKYIKKVVWPWKTEWDNPQ